MIKTFKQHLLLTEKFDDLLGQKDSIDIVFNPDLKFYGFYLPIAPSFIQKNFDKSKRMIGFHVASYKDLKPFIAIQNTKKSVSVTTLTNYNKMDNSIFGRGIVRLPDVVIKLEGDVLSHWAMDVHSIPDRQGRRWVSLNYIKNGLSGSYATIDNLPEIIEKKLLVVFNIMIENFRKSSSPELQYIIDESYKYVRFTKLRKWADLESIYFTIVDKIGNTNPDLSKNINKLKAMIISTYISVLQKLMIQYKKKFQDILFPFKGYGKNGEYDEALMTNFEIKEILSIETMNGITIPDAEKEMKRIGELMEKDLKVYYPNIKFETGFLMDSRTKFHLSFKPSFPLDKEFLDSIKFVENKYGVELDKPKQKSNYLTFIKEIDRITISDRLKADGISYKIPKLTIVKTVDDPEAKDFFKT